jgi:putative transposase
MTDYSKGKSVTRFPESHPRQWVDRSSPAYKDISWAYQLHYYLCFRTHRRKKLFSPGDRMDALSQELGQVCERHGFHLLRAKGYPDHLRCLLSLRPSDSISKTLQTLKTNLSRNLGLRFQLQPPVWAGGFLARSVGRVRIDAVKHYLDSQSEHHGYAGRVHPPVFRFVAKNPIALTAAHSVFDLNHHVVLATRYRRGIFGSRSGRELLEYWERVATKKGFAIDRATVLPDHVHLLVRIVPKFSIEECVLTLMNNSQHWFGNHYSEVSQLWQSSAYVGTSGKVTTALVKSFLSRDV